MQMATATPLPYIKMNGLGNDFVVLDARVRPIAPGARAGARHFRSRTRGSVATS